MLFAARRMQGFKGALNKSEKWRIFMDSLNLSMEQKAALTTGKDTWSTKGYEEQKEQMMGIIAKES